MVKSKALKLLRKRLEKAENVDIATILSDMKIGTSAAGMANLDIQACKASELSKSVRQQCLDLFEHNMGELYRNSSWGLDLDAKRTELEHTKARYLLMRKSNGAVTEGDHAPSDCENVENKYGNLVAFCHYRFEVDDEEAPESCVLYCYELQVAAHLRRQGWGATLMMLLESIAQQAGMNKVLLTVFRSNGAAMQFYLDKLNYQIDESSPSQHNEVTDYEILSKIVLQT